MERNSKKKTNSILTSFATSSSSSSEDDQCTKRARFPFVPKPKFSSKVHEIVLDAKKRHRSDIGCEEWDREGWAGSDVCERPLDEKANPIRREHARDLTVERFIEEYERPYIPVVIEGIPEVEKWRATTEWTLQKVKKNYKKAHLKCGEDDDGKSIRMKFKYFMKYLKKQTDDSPLYIFDSSFDDREDTKPLLKDYQVPKYFPQDLFELVGEDRRPPYRWFLVGPKRSGTCVHLDPLGTSAWNTLLAGRKRWVLFPPEVSKKIVKGKNHIFKGEDDEAINYFGDILPRIKQANMHDSEFKCIEFIQYPGETVFVPGGWWHAVFNVEDTIAVTQNFCSAQNFEQVWKKTRSGRKRMAVKWLKKLESKYPKLAKKAKKYNKQDGYQMYPKKESESEKDSDDQLKKKRKKKHQKRSMSTKEEESGHETDSPMKTPRKKKKEMM